MVSGSETGSEFRCDMDKETKINYYITFEDYTQGLQLQEFLRGEKIFSRIAPAPRSIQKELGCGMSLLIREEDIDAARACIDKNHAEYHSIVPLPCQINPKRNRFC